MTNQPPPPRYDPIEALEPTPGAIDVLVGKSFERLKTALDRHITSVERIDQRIAPRMELILQQSWERLCAPLVKENGALQDTNKILLEEVARLKEFLNQKDDELERVKGQLTDAEVALAQKTKEAEFSNRALMNAGGKVESLEAKLSRVSLLKLIHLLIAVGIVCAFFALTGMGPDFVAKQSGAIARQESADSLNVVLLRLQTENRAKIANLSARLQILQKNLECWNNLAGKTVVSYSPAVGRIFQVVVAEDGAPKLVDISLSPPPKGLGVRFRDDCCYIEMQQATHGIIAEGGS